MSVASAGSRSGTGREFPRIQRICEAKVFAQVFAKRQRYSRGVVQLYVRANECGRPRLGMAISRNAAGTAVRRNRLKRLTRETFRQLSPCLGGVDLVININKPMPTPAFNTYTQDLHALFEKASTCAPR